MRVLFLSANPFESGKLTLDKEYREISESKELTKYRDEIEICSVWAVRPKDFFNSINKYNPDVLHFCGHGEQNGDLIFEDDNGKNKYLSKEVIEKMVKSIAEKIKLIVFNNCYSYIQAETAVKYVDVAIGMNDKIEDEAAIKFALQLYSSIGYGLNLKKAFEQAKSLMMTENEKWYDVPVMFKRSDLDIDDYYLVNTINSNPKNIDNTEINIGNNYGQINISTGNSAVKAIYNSKANNKNDFKFKKIYISSTKKDLYEYQKAVKEIIEDLKEQYSEIEYNISNDKDNISECFSKIDECNLFIGIYAWNYGYIPIDEKLSIIECEYNYAREKGIISFCYVIDREYPWKISFVEFETYDKLKKFREKVLKFHKEKFRSTDHLKSLVSSDLTRLLLSIQSNKNENVDLVKEYKRVLSKIYSKLKMLGDVGNNKSFDMDKVYIPLTVNSDSKYLKDCHGFVEEFSETSKVNNKSIEAKDLINTSEKVSVILGEPGMGKSTLLHYMTYKESIKEKGLFPIFIKLSDLDRNDKSLEDNLITSVKQIISDNNIDDTVKNLIKRNKVLILLDGLDEVSSNSVRERIEFFLKRYENVKVIITSRKTGYKDIEISNISYEIDRLPIQKMKDYIDNWFSDNKKDGKNLIDSIERKESTRIRELAQNPFLLSIICLIFEKSKSLPKRRLGLYKKCTDTLLNIIKEKGRKNLFGQFIKEDFLKDLAYYFFSKNVNEFSRIELNRIVSDTCNRNRKNCNEDEIIDEIVFSSGILQKSGEKYIFIHRTFFEYYVACKFSETENLKDRILENFHNAKWEEPIRLYSALIDSEKEGTSFIKKLWKKDRLLALRCYPEMDKVISVYLIKKLLQDSEIGERVELVKGLMEKVSEHEKIVETIKGLFQLETNGEVLYWAVDILEKIKGTPGATELIYERIDKGAAERRKKYLEQGNEFKFEFIKVEKGSFKMGDDIEGYKEEKPVHEVKLDEFWIGKFEVTNKLYEEFDIEHKKKRDRYSIGDNQPALYVNWYESVMFCRWIGCKLPTEAQWEYSCRAGTNTPFNTGDNLTTEQANYDGNYPYKNYPKGKFIGKTTEVGTYAENKFGICDMHGNVWEWCEDWYDKNYYNKCYKKGIVENPTGPDEGDNRVLRGGSWRNFAVCCRSAYRYYCDPGYRYDDIGFRVVFVP